MTYIERIFNAETGETTERNYTNAEIAQVNANREASEKRIADAQADAAIKATEKAALLAKLGITEDEARLLLE